MPILRELLTAAEVDRLRAQLGGKPDLPPEDRVGGDETSDETDERRRRDEHG